MSLQIDWKKALPYILAVPILLAVSLIYNSPVLQGEVLAQDDITQWKGMAREVMEFRDATGEDPLWTNNMFGGMPTYMISTEYPANFTQYLADVFRLGFGAPVSVMFLMFIGFFVLLATNKVNPWLAMVGAIAFGLGSWFLISIEAGHNKKMIAIAYMAPVIAGTMLAYRGKYLWGGLLVALTFAVEVQARHLQISYYLAIILLFMGVAYLVFAIKDGKYKQFGIATGTVVLAMLLALGPNLSKLWTTADYAKHTIRGGKSELAKKKAESDGGLDFEYATRWSYGIGESLTFIIPSYYGGGYRDKYDQTKTYEQLMPALTNNIMQQRGVNKIQAEAMAREQLHAYFYRGPGPINGSVYFGVIVAFLFVLGMREWKNPIKWALLAVAIFGTMVAWGGNFKVLYEPLFKLLPMFDKFRTPSMWLAIPGLILPFVGFMGLQAIIDKKAKVKDLWKSVYIAGAVVGAFLLLFGVLGLGGSFAGPNDAQLGQMAELIQSDRANMVRMDGIRGLFLISALMGLIYFYMKAEKLKLPVFMGGVALLILVDMWGVGKRYFNASDFHEAQDDAAQFVADQVDQQIQQDPDPNFRVLNLTVDVFNDATTSYHHFSVGGYHPAKLMIYQDLIENRIAPEMQKLNQGFDGTPVLNMLNTKYLKFGNQGQVMVQQNPKALGNAWFVSNLEVLASADDEMAALGNFKPAQTAILDTRYVDKLNGLGNVSGVGTYQLPYDSASSIQLTDYKPNHLTYSSQASKDQFAVFSEVWYEGNKDWMAYVDGEFTPHVRVNYALRGMVIPAGAHTVEFKFEPKGYYKYERYSLIFSILWLLLVLGALGYGIYRDVLNKEPEVKA